MSKKSKSSQGRQLLNLFLVVLIDLIGFGMIIPLIPYIGKSTGVSAPMVGLLMSIYSIMQFFFAPFWGGLSDRYGRKPVLLISIAGATIAHTAFAFVSGYWALFATRLFAGLFGANISTAMASASDLSTPEKRTQSMGLIGAAFGLGFVLGPFLGAQGAQLGEALNFASWGGQNNQFASLIAGLLSLVNFLFCFFIFEESLKEKSSQLKINFKKLNPISSLLGTSKEVQKSVGLFFTATLALALIEVVLFLVVEKDYAWDYQQAALGFAAIGLVMAFTQGGLIRPLKKRFSEIQLVVTGGLLFTAGLFGAFLFSQLNLFGASVLLLSFGYAILNPSLTGFISLQSATDKQGQTFGVTHGFSALSRILGPVAGTLLLQNVSNKSPFLFASLLFALSLCLFLIFFKRKIGD